MFTVIISSIGPDFVAALTLIHLEERGPGLQETGHILSRVTCRGPVGIREAHWRFIYSHLSQMARTMHQIGMAATSHVQSTPLPRRPATDVAQRVSI